MQVNGHQIMDEPMEEGESFTHCVSKDNYFWFQSILLICTLFCVVV